jgi:hypothetical protein
VSAWGKSYDYDVTFELRLDGVSVASETLLVDGSTFLHRDGPHAELQSSDGMKGIGMQVDSETSMLAIIGDTGDLSPIGVVRRHLERLVIVRPRPGEMQSLVDIGQRSELDPSLKNFLAWYAAIEAQPYWRTSLQSQLHTVWPDFVELSVWNPAPNMVTAEASFSCAGNTTRIRFDQLSDGERLLLALHSLATYQRLSPPTTMIFDEPDNFLGLPEIQPWLLDKLDGRPEGGQVIAASHNPEVIKTMGPGAMAYFSRDDHLSPTKVWSVRPSEDRLPLDELMSRGWIDDELVPLGTGQAD